MSNVFAILRTGEPSLFLLSMIKTRDLQGFEREQIDVQVPCFLGKDHQFILAPKLPVNNFLGLK